MADRPDPELVSGAGATAEPGIARLGAVGGGVHPINRYSGAAFLITVQGYPSFGFFMNQIFGILWRDYRLPGFLFNFESGLASLADLRLTARFLPFSSEASLLLASSEPPSFAFAAIRGGFSSLSLGTLFGMRVLRLAYPAAALPKYSRSPATLRFCRLASEKNHQKSPRSLKIRQTPGEPHFRLCGLRFDFLLTHQAAVLWRFLLSRLRPAW